MAINNSANLSKRKTKYDSIQFKTLCYATDKDMRRKPPVYTFDNGRIKLYEKGAR